LPSRPKIFHGREFELEHMIKILHQDSPRLVILGAGGMGKSSLARAALHHPYIATKYEHRFFVVCDSATNSIELAAVMGVHIGLKPGRDLRKAVANYFSQTKYSLLILDNFETPWEPFQSRSDVEEFVSLLTDVRDLALMITMRGAERPGKVRWSHPFLAPLKPLSKDAAREVFHDIADDFHDSEEMDRLLGLTDNMPLAINLMAHLVDSEGCANVLNRWETEKTSLLSEGPDRRSSLDQSIIISLSSPRITSLPGAKDLLSLLSILPDGLSNVELLQSNIPIQDPLTCAAALLATSLAYNDDKRRLKSLFPIREHMQTFYPPSPQLIRPLRNHFHLLLDIYWQYLGLDRRINQISSNAENIYSILSRGL
ncbi:P-loop containing nucleoside triphosphate hydrolase protein, partial [Mycena albidolilacea]